MFKTKFRVGDTVKLIKFITANGTVIPEDGLLPLEFDIIRKIGVVTSITDTLPDRINDGRYNFHYRVSFAPTGAFSSPELELISRYDYYDEI